jgi:integrase
MSRARNDGTPAREPRKVKITAGYLKKGLEPGLHWDAIQRGLALKVQPSGRRAWKLIYSIHNRVRWLHLGDTKSMDLAKARKQANKKRGEIDDGKDPQAEKIAQRHSETFQDLAARYVTEHAEKENRSWRQAAKLVERHLLEPFGRTPASLVSRKDVEKALGKITSEAMHNQTLAACSAIFTWAIASQTGGVVLHPCKGIKRYEANSRERVLSGSEMPRFWSAFGNGPAGTALKLILLTGQRPGEVSHIRAEHIRDGWWEMPGQPDATLGWPGTKNGESHRVWLSAAVQALLTDLPRQGFILADRNGRTNLRLPDVMRAICNDLGITNRATPHDLRRSFATTVASLGFGRAAVDRILNHRDGGVGSIYDRYGYAEEDKRIMEMVASEIVRLAEGRPPSSNIIPLRGS